jgi:hypothetical protein
MSDLNDLPTADNLLATDPALKGLDKAKYASLASDDALAQLKRATENNKWKFHLVDNKAAALEIVVKSIPDGVSIYSTGSVGLKEIGFTAYAQKHPDKWDNLKAKVLAEKDPAKQLVTVPNMSSQLLLLSPKMLLSSLLIGLEPVLVQLLVLETWWLWLVPRRSSKI